MKYLFKVILLFLIAFNFIVPVVHYSATVAVLIAGIYYLFVKKSVPFTYFFSRYSFIIFVGSILMVLFDLLAVTLHGNVGIGFLLRYIVQGWMLICLVFVLPILMDNEETAFNDAMTVICGAFALQGLVHTLAFLMPSFGEFILNFQSANPERIRAATMDINHFRFYALTGAPFFDLPSAYGVACIIFFRLQLIPGQNYLRGWKAFTVMVFMILGIMLSGRTGFIGLGLGLAFYLIYKWNDLAQMWRNILKITFGFLCLLAIFYAVLTPSQRGNLINNVFPFAFEAYYNWRDYGRFSTGSSDMLMQVHYFPLEPKTLMWGDGGVTSANQDYIHTDAGYMNHIMIGGIPYLLLAIIYQWLYFWQPMKMARREQSKNGNINFFCFFLLFAHMFILEYKGAAFGFIHIVEVLLLYIGISYLAEQYALEEPVKEKASSEKLSNESVFA